jgi:hypothetical protein
MPGLVSDLEYERDVAHVAKMDDETLLYVFIGLSGEMDGAPDWGLTPKARVFKRILFTEIAARWIPPDVFGAAFRRLEEGEDA